MLLLLTWLQPEKNVVLLNLNLALERPNLNAIGGISTDTFEGNGVEGGADVDDDEYGW
jgi:hypothetical protein